MPRDLKEPEGWRFSSLRKMRHPAALDRAADSINGVETHGLGKSGGDRLPITENSWALLWTSSSSTQLKGSCRIESFEDRSEERTECLQL